MHVAKKARHRRADDLHLAANAPAENVDEVKGLRPLEQYNSRLKKLLAEHDLEIEETNEISAKDGQHTRQTLVDV